MKGKSNQKQGKGVKAKDNRPSRRLRSGYGLIRRQRARKGAGNRREAQHREMVRA